jgi:hypothetical protein
MRDMNNCRFWYSWRVLEWITGTHLYSIVLLQFR